MADGELATIGHERVAEISIELSTPSQPKPQQWRCRARWLP